MAAVDLTDEEHNALTRFLREGIDRAVSRWLRGWRRSGPFSTSSIHRRRGRPDQSRKQSSRRALHGKGGGVEISLQGQQRSADPRQRRGGPSAAAGVVQAVRPSPSPMSPGVSRNTGPIFPFPGGAAGCGARKAEAAMLMPSSAGRGNNQGVMLVAVPIGCRS